MNIKVNWDNFPQERETYEMTFAARAWVPFIIDDEEYNVEIGIEVSEHMGTGDYIINDVWIDQLEGAPEFELTEEMKKELADAIIELPESSGIRVIESNSTMKTIMNFDSFLNEKWTGDVKVKQTGEHAGKTIAEINKEITSLKDKHDKAKEKNKNYKVSDADRTKMSQLLFAKRAKKHWKK